MRPLPSLRGSSGFNPRPRTGGDATGHRADVQFRSFNPRPRTGGDTSPSDQPRPPLRFNPRPRTGGDDPIRDAAVPRLAVSIHAPGRGATPGTAAEVVPGRFQSTPPDGGRPWPAIGGTRREGFNPRPRTGGDSGWSPPVLNMWGFQSTPPDGGRRTDPTCHSPRALFQSTPPDGGRPAAFQLVADRFRFQSTPPDGGRRADLPGIRQRALVSIHAPGRGATPAFAPAWPGCGGFNPRPRTGGDGPARVAPHRPAWFQSTPPDGGRRQRRATGRLSASSFNPRPRTGGDRPVDAVVPAAA